MDATSLEKRTTPVDDELRIPIASEVDIVLARQQGRNLAGQLGASSIAMTLIATAISELARNIVQYARRGEIVLSVVEGSRRGIQIVARDQGPGIPDLDLAMRDGYSTGGSLGLGLPGAKRLMDEFTIDTEVGKGTTVSMRKWLS
jgi:serine/threonine-protein kinase RsbT